VSLSLLFYFSRSSCNFRSSQNFSSSDSVPADDTFQGAEADHEASSHSDSDLNSRTSHRFGEDSEQDGENSEQDGVGNSDVNSEDESEPECALDRTADATEERRVTDATEDSGRRMADESFSESRTTEVTDESKATDATTEHRTNDAQTDTSKAQRKDGKSSKTVDTTDKRNTSNATEVRRTVDADAEERLHERFCAPLTQHAAMGHDASGDDLAMTLPPMTTSTDQGVDVPRGSRGALENGMSVHVSAIEVDSPPVGTVATHPVPTLVSINQTEFTIEAQPTRRGRIRRTRDMMEVTACICGNPVESESRNSDAAVQCGYRGCETLWVSALPATAPTSQFLLNDFQFHLQCLNFDVAPRSWRCPNHIRPTKRQRC
jgi:hypothetical protein